MTVNQFKYLVPGTTLKHARYGLCSFKEFIGVLESAVISPDTEEGKELLANDSGVNDIPDFLEDDLNELSTISEA